MKPIEIMVRSPVWNQTMRKAFFAHLDKPMKDDARLDYCRRKADFIARTGNLARIRDALELITFALGEFTKAEKSSRAHALASRSVFLRDLGEKKESAKAWRAAKRLDSTLAD